MKQDDQRADATQADAANRRADANRADAVADERNFDDAVEAVVKRLEANRANTLALCACLAICETRMPYREAEALIGQRPELNLSTQNAHALLRIMIDCGGVETEEVPEPACEPGDDKQDQPVDYTVRTTEAGRAALAQFEPTKRFGCKTNLPATPRHTPSCSPCARTARRRPPSSRRLRATPR